MTENSHEKQLKAVIYDLDGTIADSFDIFVETLQEITKQPKSLTSEQIKDLRGNSINDMMTKFGVKKWQIPFTVMRGRREMAKKVDRIDAFTNMPEVVQDIAATGLDQYILSTNAQDGIKSFLGRYGLLNSISNIYADIGLTGKARHMKKLMKKEHLGSKECIYVGDETRDVEAARKAGMKCISVAWGFSNLQALKAEHPDLTVNTPKDLKQAILSFVN